MVHLLQVDPDDEWLEQDQFPLLHPSCSPCRSGSSLGRRRLSRHRAVGETGESGGGDSSHSTVGSFLSDSVTRSLSSIHIHSLITNTAGPTFTLQRIMGVHGDNDPHSSLHFCPEHQTFGTVTGHDGVVTLLLLWYCETDDITTFFPNSYSRTTWLMDLSKAVSCPHFKNTVMHWFGFKCLSWTYAAHIQAEFIF